MKSHISQVTPSSQFSDRLPLVLFQCKLSSTGDICFLSMSESAFQLFELSADTIKNNAQQLLDTISKEDVYDFISSIYNALHYAKSWQWEGLIRLPSGDEKIIKGEAACINGDNSPILNGVLVDISSIKSLNTELEKSKELLTETGKLAKIGTWEIDLLKMDLHWSEEVYRMHEVELGQKVDIATAISFYAPQTRSLIEAAVNKALQSGESYNIDLPLITAKGNLLWVRTSGNVITENGKPVRMFGVFQDVTEQKQVEERHRVMFEYSTDAHLLIDENGIIDCNYAAVEMLKCNHRNDLISYQPSKFWTEYQPDGRKSAEKAIEMNNLAYANGKHCFEWMHKRMDGENILVEVTLNPVTVNSKAVLLVVWHDITMRKRDEERIKKNEMLLEDTQQLTHSGSWEMNLITGENYWSSEAFRIFGLEPKGNGPSTEEFDKMIHPEDRQKYIDEVKRALKGGTISNFDLRILLPSGEIKYIQAIGKPEINETGQAIKLFGAIIDITKYKTAEEVIRLKQKQLNTFIEVSPAAIAVFDKDMRYIAASNIWKKDYKLEDKEIMGLCHYDLFPDSSLKWKEFHERGMAGEIVSNSEDSYIKRSGKVQWFRWEIRPWFEKEDEIGGIIIFTEVITERKNAEKALIKAKEEAENAANVKTQFLSTMSHEIRTPMNAVIGFTHLLLQNPREDQLEYLNILKFSGENLLVLINDILDFSKIEAGKLEFENVDFNIKDLLRNVSAAMLHSANEKKIELNLIIDDDLPEAIIGDSVRLVQILTNLISNAVKFTDQGKVTVSASVAKKGTDKTIISFEVKDTGIGIPIDMQQAIFESFTQASSDTTRKYGGTGLGLTITKRLIELQGSTINLISEPGKGSIFYFNLTFQNSAVKIASADPYNLPPIPKSLKGVKVLIVEDNPINVLLVKKFLKQWEITCDVAENGAIAVELAGANIYNLILMDLQMPVMDGYEATQQIRKLLPEERYKKLPIIALTASAMLDNKDKTFIVGMNDYVNKPFNPDELYRKIVQYSKVFEEQ